jgi:hypothetical protein
MWNVSMGREIARILNLMADKPNRRPDPDDSAFELFDGGRIYAITGSTAYDFSDGSRAVYGSEAEWGLWIRRATGEEIKITLTPKRCPQCGEAMLPGRRDCLRCDNSRA